MKVYAAVFLAWGMSAVQAGELVKKPTKKRSKQALMAKVSESSLKSLQVKSSESDVSDVERKMCSKKQPVSPFGGFAVAQELLNRSKLNVPGCSALYYEQEAALSERMQAVLERPQDYHEYQEVFKRIVESVVAAGMTGSNPDECLARMTVVASLAVQFKQAHQKASDEYVPLAAKKLRKKSQTHYVVVQDPEKEPVDLVSSMKREEASVLAASAPAESGVWSFIPSFLRAATVKQPTDKS